MEGQTLKHLVEGKPLKTEELLDLAIQITELPTMALVDMGPGPDLVNLFRPIYRTKLEPSTIKVT